MLATYTNFATCIRPMDSIAFLNIKSMKKFIYMLTCSFDLSFAIIKEKIAKRNGTLNLVEVHKILTKYSIATVNKKVNME